MYLCVNVLNCKLGYFVLYIAQWPVFTRGAPVIGWPTIGAKIIWRLSADYRLFISGRNHYNMTCIERRCVLK